jgi:hypothetical protein
VSDSVGSNIQFNGPRDRTSHISHATIYLSCFQQHPSQVHIGAVNELMRAAGAVRRQHHITHLTLPDPVSTNNTPPQQQQGQRQQQQQQVITNQIESPPYPGISRSLQKWRHYCNSAPGRHQRLQSSAKKDRQTSIKVTFEGPHCHMVITKPSENATRRHWHPSMGQKLDKNLRSSSDPPT